MQCLPTSDFPRLPAMARVLVTASESEEDLCLLTLSTSAACSAGYAAVPLATARDSDDEECEGESTGVPLALARDADSTDAECESEPTGAAHLPLTLVSDDSTDAPPAKKRSRLTKTLRRPRLTKPFRRPRQMGPEPAIVMSDADAQALFSWPRIALIAAMAVAGENLWQASCLFAAMRMSSHFSGLGAAEVALDMLRAWAGLVARMELGLSHGWTCEKVKALQRVLQDRVPGHCVFDDILDRLLDVGEDIRRLTRPRDRRTRTPKGALNFERVRSVIMTSRVSDHAQCVTHGCLCRVERVEVDVSGSPCRPWSSARKARREERRTHQDIILLLAWCRVMREDRPLVAIHENVRGFDVSLLFDLLGDIYHIQVLHAAPQELGFTFVSRPRVYCILTLRSRVERVLDVQDVYRAIARDLARPVAELPQLFSATAEEKLEAENAARAKCGMEPLTTPSRCWRYLLTTRQATCLAFHESQAVGRADLAACYVDLTPSAGFARPSRHVPTLRRCAHRIWSWRHARWLLSSELALLMGFPVRPTCAAASGVSPDIFTLTEPQALGNAMHVASVGCIIAAALSSCRRVSMGTRQAHPFHGRGYFVA